MSRSPLRGVFAAIATPVDAAGNPDRSRLVDHARRLLAEGCDGLNLLGTTGEATSFGIDQRVAVMEAVAASDLPLDQVMVGTGAAAASDAVALSMAAARLGFAGALVLPPFYYKPVTDGGIVRYIGAIVEATAPTELPVYLYNFPALSGIPYTLELVAALIERFGDRIAGLKDSSGDLPYARAVAALSDGLAVFPSNEATLTEARGGGFAGCISATANLNAPECAAAWREGDDAALARAVRIRALFDGVPLVAGIKHVLAERYRDPSWRAPMTPLTPLAPDAAALVAERVAALQA